MSAVTSGETPKPPGRGPREERYRLASVAAGIPLLLLVTPILVPLDGGHRSPLAHATREPVALLLAIGFVLWSLLVGSLCLAYGLRRQVPRTAVFAVPAVVYAVVSGGAAALFVALLAEKRHAREQPVIYAAAIACGLAFYLLARGFRRGGWERWAQLVAGVWLGQGTIELLVVFGDSSPAGDQPAGAWVLLFALGALAPIVGWALWPRRGEEMLRRGVPERG